MATTKKRTKKKSTTSVDWRKEAKQIIRAEIKRRGFTYEEVAIRLNDIGLNYDKNTLANLINRGSFQFSFFLAVMSVIGTHTVLLSEPKLG